MSELCHYKTQFSSILISDLILFCSFLLSHPLYLSYFIFFSPYLLKLVSFLSPLFFTTALLFLALLTAIFSSESPQNSLIFPFLERLRPQKDSENGEVENLEMYEIVFGSSVMEEKNEVLEEKSEEEGGSTTLHASGTTIINEENPSPAPVKENSNFPEMEEKDEVFGKKIEKEESTTLQASGTTMINQENPAPAPEKEPQVEEEKRLENFLKIIDEFERMSSNVEVKKKFKRRPLGSNSDKALGKQSNGSEAEKNCSINKINSAALVDDDGKDNNNSIVKSHSQRTISSKIHEENGSSRTMSYGSMRKEKEWKRTLACKLFEERHNVDGGDGMDSLWETYENDSIKTKSKNEYNKNKKNEKKKKNKKSEVFQDFDLEEEIDHDGQLCCLQALKLSAGKMNLGMGRPNLVKFSKAIKGIGWLYNVSKHSKKVHNNGDRY